MVRVFYLTSRVGLVVRSLIDLRTLVLLLDLAFAATLSHPYQTRQKYI